VVYVRTFGSARTVVTESSPVVTGALMSQPAAAIAATLSSVLTLLRAQPPRREDQARAFKSFLKALGEGPLDLRISEAGLELGGAPVTTELPGVTELADHLRGHGIASIRLEGGLPPSSVLSVLRALSSPVGRFESVEHLTADIDPEVRQHVRIGAPGEDGGEHVDQAKGFIAGDEILHGSAVPAQVGEAPAYRHLGRVPGQQREEALRLLESDPTGVDAPGRLESVVAGVDSALRERDYDSLVSTAAAVARLERQVPDGELKRAYQIAIRRMLPSKAVEHIAKLTGGPLRQDALEVLKHAGADASDTLLHELVESDSMEQRRALYNALRQVNTASPLLGRLLLHDEWFVIRNVAELCGDLRAEDTVPQLARHVNHGDERVRRAVAGALAKIGTSIAVEPLRQMLHDPSPQVRLQAVQGLDGTRSRGLAMSLALAAEEETNADVLRELLLALGRIGTPDAVQALARAAAPGRRLFNRRPLSTRLAAIGGLRVAGSAPAATALQGLLGDDEQAVRDAAQEALSGMKRA
jgi:HEAT repeat protein